LTRSGPLLGIEGVEKGPEFLGIDALVTFRVDELEEVGEVAKALGAVCFSHCAWSFDGLTRRDEC